jgi:DNA-binding GntR family transcriptional regulator
MNNILQALEAMEARLKADSRSAILELRAEFKGDIAALSDRVYLQEQRNLLFLNPSLLWLSVKLLEGLSIDLNMTLGVLRTNSACQLNVPS